MYEELRGYDSIDQLMEEQRDGVKKGLNELPQYINIVKAMARGREYKIGIFVELPDRSISPYISYNEENGEIKKIEKCLDTRIPDFALRVKECTLLRIIENADDVRDKLSSHDCLGVFSYIGLGDIYPGRAEDWLKFRTYVNILIEVLR